MNHQGTYLGEKFWLSRSPVCKRDAYLVVNGVRGGALAKAVVARNAGHDIIGNQCFYMTLKRAEKFRLLFMAGFNEAKSARFERMFEIDGKTYALYQAVKIARDRAWEK